MASDNSIDGLEPFHDQQSALFGKQPHIAAIDPTPYEGCPRRVKVFKNPANVPAITLTDAQSEGIVSSFESGSTISPQSSDLWSPSSTDSNCYTPYLSWTPGSIASDMSPIPLRSSNQAFDFDAFDDRSPSSLFSFPPVYPYPPLSPLPTQPLSFFESDWDLSPDPPLTILPSFRPKSDCNQSTEIPILIAANDSVLNESLPVLVDRADADLTEPDDQAVSKRRRCTPSSPGSLMATTPLPGPFTKKVTSSSQLPARRTRARPVSSSKLKEATKFNFELSSEMWLKLSPPSPTGSRSTVSLPPPSPSLSPSASPDVTNACKRKRDVHSSLPATPAQSPCPDATPLSTTGPFSGISTTGKDLCEDVGSCGDDYVMRDFFAATALSKRRSERSRAPISYAGCDVDEDPDMRVRGKAKLGKLKLKAARLTSTNETRPTKGKKSSNGKSKISCPFAFVCSSPLFGRFSDVVRHLEANELHTHAEVTRYQCGKCQAYLSRADSLQRHVSTGACDKRSPSEKVKPDYTPEEEKELDRIRNSDHPAIVGAKEKMRLSAQERM